MIVVPRAGGQELFQNCVLCHKYDGRGGPSEGGYGADLRVTKLTREEVIEVITNGRMSKGMPPFKGILDEAKIETLATFIKEESEAEGIAVVATSAERVRSGRRGPPRGVLAG